MKIAWKTNFSFYNFILSPSFQNIFSTPYTFWNMFKIIKYPSQHGGSERSPLTGWLIWCYTFQWWKPNYGEGRLWWFILLVSLSLLGEKTTWSEKDIWLWKVVNWILKLKTSHFWFRCLILLCHVVGHYWPRIWFKDVRAKCWYYMPEMSFQIQTYARSPEEIGPVLETLLLVWQRQHLIYF